MVKKISYASYSVSQVRSSSVSQTVKQRPRLSRSRSAVLIAIALAGLIPLGWILLQTATLRRQAETAQAQLQTEAAEGLFSAIQATGHSRALPWRMLPSVQTSLLDAVQNAREINRLTLNYPVTAVGFSPDGQTIAAADEAGDVHLWNQQGQRQQILEGNGQRISALNFSPDGSALFANSAETLGTAQFWRLSDGSDYQAPAQDYSSAAAFSSDGRMIISGNDGGRVRLWDRSGSVIARLYPRQVGPVTSVGFNGPAIVSGDQTGRISLWSNKGTALGQLWAGASIRSLRLDQNGERIISQDANRQQAFLWDKGRNTWNQFLLGTSQTVQSADLSADQQIVANGKTNGQLSLRPLDPQNRRVLAQSFVGHAGAINAVAFSADNRTVLTGGEDGTVRLWAVQDGLLISRYSLQDWATTALGSRALSPDGQQVALSSGGIVRLGDSKQQSRLQIVDPFEKSQLAFRPDGQELIAQTTNRNGTVSFSLQDRAGKETARFSVQPDAPLQHFALSPNGQRLLSLSTSGTVQLWNRQGQAMATAQAPAATQFIVFSPDGQRLISGSASPGSQTCLWRLQGNQLQQQTCQDLASRTVAFSRDGQQAALGANGTVSLWNLERDQITTWQVGQAAVVALAFSRDGATIASGSADGQIRLSLAGKAIGQPLVGHGSAVQALAFRDQDQTLVSLGSDGEVRLWQGNWQGWLKTACQRLANHPDLRNAQTPAERSARGICASVGSATPVTDPPAPPPAAAAETRLVVKLSERKVYLYQGEQLQATYPIAVGKAGWETPTGTFRVFSMLENPGWTHPITRVTNTQAGGTPLGSRWIAFWGDGINQIGFHATPDRASVGQAISHGCLRMYDADARALYEQVKLGTWVIVQP